VSLNGDGWKLNLSPPSNFYDPGTAFSGWEDITIPSQVDAGEDEYAYAYGLKIPSEWKDHRIFLRFDGVNCYTRLFVDGVFLRDHYGGFVSWDCEITGRVIPSGEHRLVLGVTDKPREICSFHRGGIIRDVTLYALPRTYLARFHAETVFDRDYKDADLKVSVMSAGGDASAELTLISPEGTRIALGKLLCKAGEDTTKTFHITAPLKWDSEHPRLYTLGISLTDDHGFLERAERKIGFRQIERRGSEVYVNGDLLKLRGINRHDIYPASGRVITGELVEEDVRLFKEANINFIRTSHYPPRPDFLDLCDRYGMYVEDEIAVAFIGYGVRHTENDPEYTARFIDQFAELIERDRSHPCVIIWSLANESFWGENIARMNAYAHAEDPGRLTIFSFPINQREDDDLPDIWSFHYSGMDRDITALADSHWRSYREQVPIPVLHDESTHIPCYNTGEMRRDPGVRDFWGETILRFWDMLWEKKGALGCAIWAGIDDVGERRGSWYTGYTWGIIDGWRRKKPEYWHTRKAYSPVRLKDLPESREGKISIPVENHFNHTNLREIEISWTFNGFAGKFPGPDIQPRGAGWLEIPVLFVPGKRLDLSFTDPFGNRVEEASYVLGGQRPAKPALGGGSPPGWEKTGGELRIHGRDFSLNFSEETGLITKGTYRGSMVLTGGPALNLVGLPLGPWCLEKMDVCQEEQGVRVSLDGHYDRVAVRFVIRVDNKGLMETTYTVTDMPYPSPRRIAISSSIVSHAGGYDEVGIAFTVPRELDTLTWKRKGLWSVYPDWHISRLTGKVSKFNPQGTNTPDTKPGWDWRLDENDWVLFGQYEIGRRGVRDFISTKASFSEVSLERDISPSEGAAFMALSEGSEAARMELCFNPHNIISDRDSAVVYHGNWLRQDTKFSSLGGTETWSKTAGDYCQYRFLGTGFAWISSLDVICGMADVYVDGLLKAKDIDLGLSLTGKTPRMYEKYYRCLVFSVQDLPMGEHTARIEVSGKKAPESVNSYVNIDHFVVLDGEETGDTRFIINSEFNYPCLSWGTYIKPAIKVSSGYSRTIYTKLGRLL
jgi:hypothetical protein